MTESRTVRAAAGCLSLLLLAACAQQEPAKTAEKPAAKAAAAKKPKKAEEPVLVVASAEPGKVFSTWTVDKRNRRGETRAKTRTAMPFEVDSLPVANLPEPLEDKKAPPSVDGDTAIEVVAQKHNYGHYGSYGYDRTYNTVLVKGEGFNAGSIKVSQSEGAFYARDGQTYGGVNVMCGKDEINRAARWEGLVVPKTPSAEVVYQVVDGWFDAKKCRAVAVTRTKIKLATIVPDLIYGFRQCADAECAGKANLVFVIPHASSAVAQSGPIRAPAGSPSARINVPLRRGASESVMAMIYSPKSPYTQRSVALEVVQGIADEKPIATAFLDDVK